MAKTMYDGALEVDPKDEPETAAEYVIQKNTLKKALKNEISRKRMVRGYFSRTKDNDFNSVEIPEVKCHISKAKLMEYYYPKC